MRRLTYAGLETALHEALDHKVCGSAWVTQGNPLFLDFREATGPPGPEPPRPDGLPENPYGLEVWCSDWRITQRGVSRGHFEEDWEDATEHVRALILQSVVGWRLSQGGRQLAIEFDDQVILQITARTPPEAARDDDDAWLVALPDGYSRTVRCGGGLFLISRDEPYPQQLEE